MVSFEDHLKRQISFSKAVFGPGQRMKGLIAHIRKELYEIEEADNDPREWVDVVILGLDGLWRSLYERNPTAYTDDLARESVRYIIEKQNKNESRDWPDWRTADEDKPIEHVRGVND